MKAQDLQFIQLLEGSKQFIIPIFQRTYSWELEHCEQLLNDIIRVGSNNSLDTHFIGSAVYIPELEVDASTPRWLLIDGQQRVTSLTLLILAIRNFLQENEIDEPLSAPELTHRFLINQYKKGETAYRLLPTNTDKDTFTKLLDGKPTSEGGSIRIHENFQFFSDKVNADTYETIWTGLTKLMIVDVSLQQGIDNPQMIFESMNSTGKALTQADLIRNYILMGLEHELQTRLYLDYWREMELEFGSENYTKLFDEFMRFYLVVQTGNARIRKGDVYDEFKAFALDKEVEPLLVDLKQFSTYYCRLALRQEPNEELKLHFQDIAELKADVTYPFFMRVYADFEEKLINHAEFKECVLLTESYIFRRSICDIPTNSMRQTFITLHKQIKPDHYVESLQAAYLLLPSYRRFPNNEEFERKFQERDLYNYQRRSYWLRRFENFGRKERVIVNDYTIEHIMPQNGLNSEAWRTELGDDCERIHPQYLHTLGNLTLSGYNSEYSDRPFSQKRDMEGGFKHSPLKINRGIGELQLWNEKSINSRAQRLANQALKVWQAPELSSETIDSYRKPKEVNQAYCIEDHPLLLDPETKELFESLSSSILKLDACVKREYLKKYVAFKAEANFVDIVPRTRRLFLALNISFNDLEDPNAIAKDYTHTGHPGNGDSGFSITQLDEIPYAIGLIRQALEQQL